MNESSNAPQSWAVIGGGMMGLTLAHKLSQQGQKVTVFEAGPSFGGLTDAWKIGNVTWDRFYHVVLLSDTNTLELIKDFELDEDLSWVTTKTGFYADGKLHSMSSSFEFLKFKVLNLYQKVRLASTILYGSRVKDWRALEKVKVEDWLRKISGASTFERIWLPLLKAKLGETYKRTSATFIWAYIDRMYKARRTGLKKEMFGYVQGGYARIVDRILTRLAQSGVAFEAGKAVVSTKRDNAHGRVQIEFKDGDARQFDNVIFTVPSPLISQCCPQLTAEEHRRHSQIEYLGVICASLLMKKPFKGYYVTNIVDSWVPLTGIIEMSTIVDRKELDDHTLVYLPKYVAASDDQAFAESDLDIEERFLSTLEKMYPDFSREDVAEFKVARARNVMALPTLNYSEKLPPMRTSIPGVYAINSAQIVEGNLNVNETIAIAKRAMQEILEPRIASGASEQLTPIHESDLQAAAT